MSALALVCHLKSYHTMRMVASELDNWILRVKLLYRNFLDRVSEAEVSLSPCNCAVLRAFNLEAKNEPSRRPW